MGQSDDFLGFGSAACRNFVLCFPSFLQRGRVVQSMSSPWTNYTKANRHFAEQRMVRGTSMLNALTA